MKVKEFNVLKKYVKIECVDEGEMLSKLGIKEDLLGWFQENCVDEINIFDSCGLDIDAFIFECSGEKHTIYYYSF